MFISTASQQRPYLALDHSARLLIENLQRSKQSPKTLLTSTLDGTVALSYESLFQCASACFYRA